MAAETTIQSPLRYLVQPGTLIEADGEGEALELGTLTGKPLLVVVRIDEIIEQESLHVSIWGSADGQRWGEKALFWYPQHFYRGAFPAALDLRQRPEVRFLKARWETDRWGRGYPRPFFKASIEIQELPAA
jgi:hypothetical protein